MKTFKQFIAEGSAQELPRPVFEQLLRDLEQSVSKAGGKIAGSQRIVSGRLKIWVNVDFPEDGMLPRNIYPKVIEREMRKLKGYRVTEATHVQTEKLKTGLMQAKMVFNLVKK